MKYNPRERTFDVLWSIGPLIPITFRRVGPIDTPIWERGGLPADVAAARKEAITKANPMKRYGTPDEVAAAIAFLLSSDSTYILGVELVVDGGGNQL